MAGLWNISFQQLHDLNGKPYPGAKAFFFAADSLTPLTVYQDYGLGTAHPNPVEADANGVFPAVFLDEADEFYRQRITTRSGVTISRTDLTVLPIIGPSGGGGGSEVPVDPNSLFGTGEVMWKPVSGSKTGWVRCNGRTIGAATSGAGERANADCEQLFLYLWQTYNNTICPVTGGRGLSAAADWAANKPIGLLNMRGLAPFGLDGMGNSRANRIADTDVTSGDGDTEASTGGSATQALTESQLPAHNHGGSVGSTASQLQLSAGSSVPTTAIPTTGNTTLDGGTTHLITSNQAGGVFLNSLGHTHSVANAGSGAAHNNMSPFMLGTWYMRL